MQKPTCQRCGAPKVVRPICAGRSAIVRGLYCVSCDRAKKRAWIQRNPEKRRAHLAVGVAIFRGDLIRQACEVCGERDAHAHHEDYGKPLDVTWLCSTHHAARHREVRRSITESTNADEDERTAGDASR